MTNFPWNRRHIISLEDFIPEEFELAAKRLSADTLNFSPGSSSLTKGETILDTAKTYLAMGTDLMVIRHKGSGVPATIAQEMDRLGSGVRL